MHALCTGWTLDDETVRPVSTEDPTEATTGGGGAAGSDAAAPAQMLNPDVLVSLTAPKRCSRGFSGRSHYVVQRFLPPELLRKYALGAAHVDAAVSLCTQLSLVELDASAGADDGDAGDGQQNDE